MKQIIQELSTQLESRGYQSRIVPVHHVHELNYAIEDQLKKGFIISEFYKERLAWFDFEPTKRFPGVKSIIVVAIPRPHSQACFSWHGLSRLINIPPTYVAYEDIRQQVDGYIADILKAEGFSTAPTSLPVKLLAVRSGLGAYGRNNICYVSGMGSMLQLVAVYSDLPYDEDNWRDARMMDACENCYACSHHCPSGAIPSDRFLLDAERCIVLHNERPGTVPFPAWIDPSWHDCLQGCFHCQRVCPQNREFVGWTEGREDFNEEETDLVLNGIGKNDLPTATLEKLKRLDLYDSLDILPRNLSVFFDKEH